jgi:hypothetical protein
MDTKTPDHAIPADVLADAQIVANCVDAGKPVPSEVYRRVRERGARITQEILKMHGILNIGVPGIRELRDGE